MNAEGDLVRRRDSRPGGAANRTTRTAERDIRGIGGPNTGLGCLTGPRGRCIVALNPRNEWRIPHHQKPEKHCYINNLNRGGEGGIRTHEGLLTLTPLAGERLQPLGHLSAGGQLSLKRSYR